MPQRDALAPRAYLQPLLQLEVTKRTAERHLERRAQCDRYPALDFALFRSPHHTFNASTISRIR
jgi:hypothetical protein